MSRVIVVSMLAALVLSSACKRTPKKADDPVTPEVTPTPGPTPVPTPTPVPKPVAQKKGACSDAASCAEARASLDKECQAGDAHACVALADMHQNGVGGEVDRDKARALNQQACDKGEGSGCRNLGLTYMAGIGVPIDQARANKEFAAAIQHYEKACAGDAPADADACADLGLLTQKGMGTAANPTAAAALYQKACDKGSDDGCVKLANVMVVGTGIAADATKAAELLRVRCVAGHGLSCNTLGLYYMNGIGGIRQDFTAAFHLYTKACDAGYAPGCGTLAELHFGGKAPNPDPTAAIALIEKSCELADSTGCYRLGQMQLSQGAGSAEAIAKAKTFFKRACDVGMAPACRELGNLVKATDAKQGAELLALACRLGDEAACAH